MKYQVLIHTGEVTGADTDTNVYVTLHGERGDTGKRRLVYSNNPVNFREGQVAYLLSDMNSYSVHLSESHFV